MVIEKKKHETLIGKYFNFYLSKYLGVGYQNESHETNVNNNATIG